MHRRAIAAEPGTAVLALGGRRATLAELCGRQPALAGQFADDPDLGALVIATP